MPNSNRQSRERLGVLIFVKSATYKSRESTEDNIKKVEVVHVTTRLLILAVIVVNLVVRI